MVDKPESRQQYGHLTQFLKMPSHSVTDEGWKPKTTIEMPCALGEVKSEHEEYYDDSLTPAQQPATYTNTTADADQDRPSTSAAVISRPASVGSVHSDRTEAGDILTPNSSPALDANDVAQERGRFNLAVQKNQANMDPSDNKPDETVKREIVFEKEDHRPSHTIGSSPEKVRPMDALLAWAPEHPRYEESMRNCDERVQSSKQVVPKWCALTLTSDEQEQWEKRVREMSAERGKNNSNKFYRHGKALYSRVERQEEGSNGTAAMSGNRTLSRVFPLRPQRRTPFCPSANRNGYGYGYGISPAPPSALASSSHSTQPLLPPPLRRVIRTLHNPNPYMKLSSSPYSSAAMTTANVANIKQEEDEQEIEIVAEKVITQPPNVGRMPIDQPPVAPSRTEGEGPIELGEWIARIADDLQLRMVRSGKNLILSPPKMSNSTRSLLIIPFEPTYLILNEFMGDRLQASHTWQMLGPLAQLECALRGKCYQIFYLSPKEGTGLREDVGDAIGITSLPSVGQMTINNHEEERKTAFDTEKGEIAKKKRKRTTHRCWQGQECAENPEKPPHTYKELIGMAIAAQEDHRATLTDIYNFFRDNFEYFRGANTGWKNSVRHQLSLGGYFKKDGHDRVGNGHYWTFGRNFLVPKKQAGKKMMTNNSEGKEVLLVGENISEYILNLSTISL